MCARVKEERLKGVEISPVQSKVDSAECRIKSLSLANTGAQQSDFQTRSMDFSFLTGMYHLTSNWTFHIKIFDFLFLLPVYSTIVCCWSSFAFFFFFFFTLLSFCPLLFTTIILLSDFLLSRCWPSVEEYHCSSLDQLYHHNPLLLTLNHVKYTS